MRVAGLDGQLARDIRWVLEEEEPVRVLVADDAAVEEDAEVY